MHPMKKGSISAFGRPCKDSGQSACTDDFKKKDAVDCCHACSDALPRQSLRPAGWMRSAKYDAKLLAQQALYDKYGFTREMDSFFICTVEENDGETVVTYHANEDVGDYAWKLGDYIVTIRNGQAEASWSNDGEAVGDDFSSDVWDTAMLARGMELVKAGQQWYEITGTPLAPGRADRRSVCSGKIEGAGTCAKDG